MTTRDQKHYNYVHSATRNVIERVFGLLKGCFRRLHFIACKNVKTIDDIVIACCVLHNISISEGDISLDFMNPIEVDQANAYNQLGVGPDPAGIVKRPNIKSATMNHHCTEII